MLAIANGAVPVLDRVGEVAMQVQAVTERISVCAGTPVEHDQDGQPGVVVARGVRDRPNRFAAPLRRADVKVPLTIGPVSTSGTPAAGGWPSS